MVMSTNDEMVQDHGISSALAMEITQSYTKEYAYNWHNGWQS